MMFKEIPRKHFDLCLEVNVIGNFGEHFRNCRRWHVRLPREHVVAASGRNSSREAFSGADLTLSCRPDIQLLAGHIVRIK